MDVFEALYTTRAMRRLKPDPIPDEVVARIIDAGIRAPSGGNRQGWRFMTVTDRSTVASLGALYQKGWNRLIASVYANANASSDPAGDRVRSSAQWLADHFGEVPLLVFGFAPGGTAAGPSIYPSLWSMCLAARALGVGSTLTTILNGFAEASALLGVPPDSNYQMAGCLPMGYPTGNWGVASRKPAEQVTYAERWGTAPAWSAPEPPAVS